MQQFSVRLAELTTTMETLNLAQSQQGAAIAEQAQQAAFAALSTAQRLST